ncbi:MAG: hypothetical protein IJ520_04665, partial [Synergistaceae bacterium]|nr:hypothetical protein [Synergistaceae bacterium]
MDSHEFINYAHSRATDFLTPAKKDGWICPICGSGGGDKGTGITTKDGLHFTCWTGCFTNVDIIDIIGLKNGLSLEPRDFPMRLEAAAREFNITLDKQPKHGAAQTNSAPIKNNAVTQPKPKQEQDPAVRDRLIAEFNAARQADNTHPYLQTKHVRNDGTLKINHAGELLIGLYDVDGNFRG